MLLKIALLLSIPKMWNISHEEHAWGKTSKSVRNKAVFLKLQWTSVHILNQDPQGGELPGDSDTDSLWLGLSNLTDKNIPNCLLKGVNIIYRYTHTYMQVRKQQLELDMKQQTGSK